MKTLECSSKGDKRFCTFYAFVDFDGKYKNIEAHLQDCKRNEQGYPCKKGNGLRTLSFADKNCLYPTIRHFIGTYGICTSAQIPTL